MLLLNRNQLFFHFTKVPSQSPSFGYLNLQLQLHPISISNYILLVQEMNWDRAPLVEWSRPIQSVWKQNSQWRPSRWKWSVVNWTRPAQSNRWLAKLKLWFTWDRIWMWSIYWARARNEFPEENCSSWSSTADSVICALSSKVSDNSSSISSIRPEIWWLITGHLPPRWDHRTDTSIWLSICK